MFQEEKTKKVLQAEKKLAQAKAQLERAKREEKEKELQKLIEEEKLKEEPARALVDKIFRIGECEPSDAAIAEILPPISRFKAGLLAETKMRVTDKIKEFFIKFFD